MLTPLYEIIHAAKTRAKVPASFCPEWLCAVMREGIFSRDTILFMFCEGVFQEYQVGSFGRGKGQGARVGSVSNQWLETCALFGTLYLR